jgi:catechol 2,3-dioxygenase-like lactoylglutathione lyase family enzyme
VISDSLQVLLATAGHPKLKGEVAMESLRNVKTESSATGQHHLAYVTLLVRDYDVAKDWYCNSLGFHVIEDTKLSETKRWVTIATAGASATGLLLAKADRAEQEACIGSQPGGRVFLFLQTTDFEQLFHAMTGRGVRFCEGPRKEDYGIVAVFQDLYGNRWHLIEPSGREVTQ